MQRFCTLAFVLVAVPLLVAFDLTRSSVPAEDIVSGGPPKDGIPAILAPELVPESQATFLRPEDRVVGIALDGEVKAYPIRLLNWHEIVDDSVGSTPIAVTFCPLTASAVVFDRNVRGKTLSFGVSGRLYQSNVLMYDHQTESLWSQLRAEAVTGPQTGASLRQLPAETTTWAAWVGAHPDTLVLSDDTGFRRNYAHDPYAEYHAAPYLMFETRNVDIRLPAKKEVFGVRIGSEGMAYPLAALAGVRRVEDRVGGVEIRIDYDPASDTARAVRTDTGTAIASVGAYWFAWSAFHPATRLWGESSPSPARATPSAVSQHPGGDAIVSPEVTRTEG